ncbi:aldehyde dehydrogenase [Luminiphilus syltensis NOR5-1B]|uniref:Aldehyde dehydrogenase n=1 Tax=Luminiphilus syltensis NOR5-1B TaxID=565045 RepID=B8KSW6_9GAMM|nr:coniferyl aldehyde dehydrogenase [Luminiphilus syltensis]EED35448.1 aldehyde dehydrogenase [Luminiphilus syltensis NOR5-1B]
MSPVDVTEANVTGSIDLSSSVNETLSAVLEEQRVAYRADPVPDTATRYRDLTTLHRMISENVDAIVAAIDADYGGRSRNETLFTEVITSLDTLLSARRQLKAWMKTQSRSVDKLLFPGAKNRVIPQPLGVVGLIIPWNFPLNLAFCQLASVFAAGNRAMVKMSEHSSRLTALLVNLTPRYFGRDKLAFFAETGGVGEMFSRLPLDLLMFTGSGTTGRKVMASAAANLTPVILELGGKAPAVIDPDYPLEKAVERILYVKQLNAGQICTNVDYVFVHRSQRDAFVRLATQWAEKHIPDILSQDYTALIDDRSYERIAATVADAELHGATVINCTGQPPEPGPRKYPVTLVLDTTEAMEIRKRETFGPLLMVLDYESPEEVVDYVNARDRPLALYPFSNAPKQQQYYIDRIMSGGVTVNDALLHVAQHDLPFGGVGASGMGHYHGYDGFLACSKLRPVFYQASFSGMRYLAPPYGRLADKALGFLLKRKMKR